MKRGLILAVHSIVGLVSWLFIFLMSLSGAVLIFHDELQALQSPSIIPGHNKEIISINSCYNNLQKKFPRAQISNCNIAEDNTQPFVFTIYDSSYKKGTEPLLVFLHPQTGTILKAKSGKNNFVSQVAALHNSFHLGKIGEWLLGFFALVFLLSITTGVILYRQNIGSVLLFRQTVFKKKNLHQLAGVYALLFNLMIGITGFWMQRYVFKKEFY